jgi:hypothetical protein
MYSLNLRWCSRSVLILRLSTEQRHIQSVHAAKATAKQVNVSFFDSAAIATCWEIGIAAISFLECFRPKAPKKAKVEIIQARKKFRKIAFVVFWQPNKNYGLDFSCAFYPFRLKIFTKQIKNAL